MKFFNWVKRLFKKPSNKYKEMGFDEMTRNERKDFLSNDLIERMIRVEERVARSFGEKINYKKSEYYQGLSSQERQSYERYLKGKKIKKGILSGFFLIMFCFFGLMNVEFTGNAVRENFVYDQWLDYALFGFFFLVILISIFYLLKSIRFEKNFKVLDRIARR
jgi:hypothetical protein